MILAALAAKLEFEHAAEYLDMLVAQRSQAEGAVLFGVFFISDADVSSLEELHDGGKHLTLRQTFARQIASDHAPDARQGTTEGTHPIELDEIPHLPIRRVVTVLFAAARVTSDGLDMGVGAGADPNRRPGWRNYQRPNAVESGFVSNRFVIRTNIGEAA